MNEFPIQILMLLYKWVDIFDQLLIHRQLNVRAHPNLAMLCWQLLNLNSGVHGGILLVNNCSNIPSTPRGKRGIITQRG